MKTNHKLITIAASFLAMVACGNIDDLEDRVDKIENRVSALEKVAEAINSNVQALQAIASGQAINSVEEKDGAYIQCSNKECNFKKILPKDENKKEEI